VTTVLFACVRNAGRSQIAAAYFNQFADPAKVRAISAGTRPAAAVHPVVVDVMREVGLDLSNVKPQLLTPASAAGVSWLITMGCGDECPLVPGARRDDWPIDDPHDRPVDDTRRIRDEISLRVRAFVQRGGWDRAV
jgi:arsenate reductase